MYSDGRVRSVCDIAVLAVATLVSPGAGTSASAEPAPVRLHLESGLAYVAAAGEARPRFAAPGAPDLRPPFDVAVVAPSLRVRGDLNRDRFVASEAVDLGGLALYLDSATGFLGDGDAARRFRDDAIASGFVDAAATGVVTERPSWRVRVGAAAADLLLPARPRRVGSGHLSRGVVLQAGPAAAFERRLGKTSLEGRLALTLTAVDLRALGGGAGPRDRVYQAAVTGVWQGPRLGLVADASLLRGDDHQRALTLGLRLSVRVAGLP